MESSVSWTEAEQACVADGDRLVEFHEPQQLEWMKARLIEIDNLGLAVGWPWWVQHSVGPI